MADFIIMAILLTVAALGILYQRKKKAEGALGCGQSCAGCSGCAAYSPKSGGGNFWRICRKKKKKSF